MELSTELKHIESTTGVCGGRPRIAGRRIRVQDVVLWTEQGQSPDEIVSYPITSIIAKPSIVTSKRMKSTSGRSKPNWVRARSRT